MALGVGFRVAPGVRLRAGQRGPRLSLGPRIARVHLGGGTPAISTGRGRMTVWHTLSGGGHDRAHPGVGGDRSHKAEQWNLTRAHLDALLSQHERPLTHARPPVVPEPAPVDRRTVRKELEQQQHAGVPWYRLRARAAARARARAALPEVLRQREAASATAHAAEQAAADRWWRALLANDPDTVVSRLEDAFDAQQLPATPTAVEDATAHVVVSVEPPEQLIGLREPTLTEAGNLSLARMTKTRLHELYQAAVSSAVIAITAEVFATCPGLQTVDVAVLCPAHQGGPAVLLLAELPRPAVLPGDAVQPVASSLTQLAAEQRARLVLDRGGRVGEWRRLDDHDADVRELLDVLDAE